MMSKEEETANFAHEVKENFFWFLQYKYNIQSSDY